MIEVLVVVFAVGFVWIACALVDKFTCCDPAPRRESGARLGRASRRAPQSPDRWFLVGQGMARYDDPTIERVKNARASARASEERSLPRPGRLSSRPRQT